MLAAANRLRTAAEFSQTTRRGAKSSRGAVVAYVASGDPSREPRVGVIVSKAVGGSVQRHRAARRLREAVRPLLPSLPGGTTIVLRALPGADTSKRLSQNVVDAIRTALRDRSAS